MRTRKGSRSESFWPSIVARKWLNIKPKVHEFSEDEVETESDDDDARISGGLGRPFFETEERGSTNPNSSEASGTETRVSSTTRLRRRRSETLRLNYITSKDLRVMIGTWNVAGRTPLEDLQLDEWLDTQEPADLYVLGFQEVVPLNAGNVLGAEDNRPIQKWEAIIRRSLNRSLQPKPVYKCYSAPLSPLSSSSAPPGTSPTTAHAREKPSPRSKNISIIHGGVDFDWPEYSLDTPQRLLVPGKKLRRVLSSSARIGLDWLDEARIPEPRGSAGGAGMKRVCHSSGNLGMLWSEQQAAADVLSSLNDISDRSSEEELDKFDVGAEERPSKSSNGYVRVVGKQMVGIYISVWVRRTLRRHVNNLKVSPVGVGLMGYMGNKGSVSVSMTLFQTRVCFVCSHLTSGNKEGDQQRRNSDVFDILQRTRFRSVVDADHQPQTIPSHDRIFWFGDLNYRLNLPDAEVRALVARKSWDELMNYDQLSNELRIGRIFDGWKEGSVNFPPTYKYERNSTRYVGEIAREGEKKRSPAWCDRILWLGKGIRQESYWRSELNLSDHRPVSSVFLVEVEVFDQRKLERVLNFAGAGFLAQNE
ncbi:type I inositol polyphosphate 5-phosphatase 2-like isoform X1 [Zingiber officinale]|uniref:type I inositol polyphosphate 5-phosphatase 2-like isoform X1 n=1 Tax=Zingiber officinale TaxID=94328 RepID=UPI001C4B94CD|nr:type I inositol polyphosphate 5-phosphatase 2-like isoform X1 [Zingiber officinale]